MNKTMSRLAAVGVAAAVVLTGFAGAASAAGSVKTQANGSYGPLRVYLNDTYQSDSTTSFAWTDNLIGSSDVSGYTSFTCPGGSTGAAIFISPRGQEATKANWKAFAATSLSSGSVLQPNLKPAGLTSGTPGAGAVKAAGGDYSLGLACTSNNGVTVDRTYFRYISVTASTGAYTVAATDYVYAAPTLSVTQTQANIDGGKASPHVGDTINATVGASVPDGFSVAYQWYANGTAIDGATSDSYLTLANDAGKAISATATYSRSGYATRVVASTTSYTVEGDAVTSGTVSVSAGVVDAVNGQLALDIPNNAAATMGSAALNGQNQSVTTGTLGNITVNDGRVVTRDGWDLTAKVADFVNSSNSAVKIGAHQLSIAPNLVSSPADGNVQAGASGSVVDNNTAFKLAYQAGIGGATVGNVDGSYVGTTVVNANLTLTAPQWKPAGTYTSTVTITVASR
jgi:hypothetical protein